MDATASGRRLPLTRRTGTRCSFRVIGIQLTRWNVGRKYASKFSIAACGLSVEASWFPEVPVLFVRHWLPHSSDCLPSAKSQAQSMYSERTREVTFMWWDESGCWELYIRGVNKNPLPGDGRGSLQ